MMHGREKSDSVIAAVKSPNKTGEPPGGRGSEGRGRRRMRASNARAGHRAGKACHRRRSAYGRPQGFAVTIRGGSRMRESRTSGSVRGDRGNLVPYRHPDIVQCSVCLATRSSLFPRSNGLDLLVCNECGTVYVYPPPTPAEVREI